MEREKYKKIICICTHGGLGDLLLSTPVFESLHRAYPYAEIHVMAQEHLTEILEGNPFIRRIIPVGREMNSTPAGFFRQCQIIRQEGYDMGLVLWCTAREACMLFLAGVPVRVGQAGRLLYSFLFTHQVSRRSDMGDEDTHWVDNQLDMVRVLGIEPGEMDVYFDIPASAVERVDDILEKEGIGPEEILIGFHSTKGLAVDRNRWPVEKFAGFAHSVGERFGGKILFTGTAGEMELIGEIKRLAGVPSLNMAGKLSIKEMGALIRRCRVFICPDSGPMHLSAVIKTPVAGIFALKEEFPRRWAPYKCAHKIVRLDSIPCDRHCIKAQCPRFSCYEAIPDAELVSAVEKLMNGTIAR